MSRDYKIGDENNKKPQAESLRQVGIKICSQLSLNLSEGIILLLISVDGKFNELLKGFLIRRIWKGLYKL